MKSRKAVKKMLTDLGVKVIGDSEDFGGAKGGIWISGEEGDSRINYWSTNLTYVFGIAPELNNKIEKAGWFFEWHDAGTLMAFPE